jgi:hypothetical protein
MCISRVTVHFLVGITFPNKIKIHKNNTGHGQDNMNVELFPSPRRANNSRSGTTWETLARHLSAKPEANRNLVPT